MRLSEHELNSQLVSLQSQIKCQYANECSLNQHFPNFLSRPFGAPITLIVKSQPKLLTNLEEAVWSGHHLALRPQDSPFLASSELRAPAAQEFCYGLCFLSLPGLSLTLFSLSSRPSPPPCGPTGSSYVQSPVWPQHCKSTQTQDILNTLYEWLEGVQERGGKTIKSVWQGRQMALWWWGSGSGVGLVGAEIWLCRLLTAWRRTT